jgi:hypothetical protein
MAATNNIGSGTAGGLLEFLDYLIEKNYATSSQVSPWKSAVRQVFSTVEGDGFEGFDVRTFDADEYMDRFGNAVVGEYKQESLISYRQRFKKAIALYLDFLQTNRPPLLRTTRRSWSESSGPSAAAMPKRKVSKDSAPLPPAPSPESSGAEPLIDYPFPLRSGQIAYVRLPRKLEKEDAERLGAFVRTLVYEPQLQLSAGTQAGSDSDETEGGD